MMPGMNPRALKNMMAQMGIKTSEIDAVRVVIECGDKNIIITAPQVTKINAQGVDSFQITGSVSEQQKGVAIEPTAEDIEMVSEQTGVTDLDKVRQALAASNGDIAGAILILKDEGA